MDPNWIKEVHSFIDSILPSPVPYYVEKKAERKHNILFSESRFDELNQRKDESRRQWKLRIKAVEYCKDKV
jgi:hypothetical protein